MNLPTRLPSIALALAMLLGLATALAQEPSAFELELWRAAVRLNTADSYKEYLNRFPAGAFAELARQSMRQLGTVPARAEAAQPVAAAPPGRLSPEALKGAPQETGATIVVVGDVLVGPAVTTVGWLGAKHQVLVPPGEWVTLAAYDHTVAAMTTLHLTTLVLGQFAGADLRTLLVATSTSKTPPVATLQSPHPTIPAVEQCQLPGDTDAFRLPITRSRESTCGFVRPITGAGDLPPIAPGLRERVASALAKIGARRQPFVVHTHFDIVDRASAFVGYDRFDTAAVASPARFPTFPGHAAAAEAAATTTPFAPWLLDLARLAAAGHGRRLEWPEAQPATATPQDAARPRP